MKSALWEGGVRCLSAPLLLHSQGQMSAADLHEVWTGRMSTSSKTPTLSDFPTATKASPPLTCCTRAAEARPGSLGDYGCRETQISVSASTAFRSTVFVRLSRRAVGGTSASLGYFRGPGMAPPFSFVMSRYPFGGNRPAGTGPTIAQGYRSHPCGGSTLLDLVLINQQRAKDWSNQDGVPVAIAASAG
jgi:hypothetical protein